MFINRQINEMLSEQAYESNLGQKVPRLRFFTPKEKFWTLISEIMKKHDLTMLVDCGTGNGELPIESRDCGIKMVGIDIIQREGNSLVDVHLIPAHRMPYDQKIWPLVCRPDHSGWARGVLEKAHESGSGFIYVGLRRNFAQDLGDYMVSSLSESYDEVGEENEEMLIFLPDRGV